MPLVTPRPSDILDRRGIVQHQTHAERLRQAGFDPEEPMGIESDGRTLALRQQAFTG